jgi:hypothetical protein
MSRHAFPSTLMVIGISLARREMPAAALFTTNQERRAPQPPHYVEVVRMTWRNAEVTRKKANPGRIPDAQAEGVALVLDLARRNQLEELGRRVRIRRAGGYCGFDVLLFLLLFFAEGASTGICKFWERVRPWKRQLASLARRDLLASRSAVSRSLDDVELDLLRPAAEWLLSEGAGIDLVLRHPSVQTYDARGEGWHVFHFDPTVTTLRQRALPEGADLPVARRKAKELASPGYCGRKRGDWQISRGTLQHAGSGAWLQAMLGSGNGDNHAALGAALEVIERTCKRLGHPLNRSLLLTDGAFGWVPYLSESRARGIQMLTRLTRPKLFEQPEVLRVLREGTWHHVPDSRSGPRRSALDLGMVTIPAAEESHQSNGAPYDPIEMRVVVSRYPREREANHGVVLDGWQYELFVVDVPIDALSAAEAVGLYFSRAGQENRFAQEDREIGLDRIFSYHLPGQEFAVVIGLWLWNLRLVRGFELQPPPAVRPQQEVYLPEVDIRRACIEPSAPAAETQTDYDSSQDTHDDGANSTNSRQIDAIDGLTAPENAGYGEPSLSAANSSSNCPKEMWSLLNEVDWNEVLSKRAMWSWDEKTGHLRCPSGELLILTSINATKRKSGRTGVVFCMPTAGCTPCTRISACLRSSDPRPTKHTEVSIPNALANRLRTMLAEHRRTKGSFVPRTIRPRKPTAVPLPGLFQITPIELTKVIPAMQWRVATSLFLPAAARQLWRKEATRLIASVTIVEPAPPQPTSELIAASVAERQHRRKTWKQNLERHALSPDTRVLLDLTCSDILRNLFGLADELAAG